MSSFWQPLHNIFSTQNCEQVTFEINKVYPGAKIWNYQVSTYKPGEPLLLHDEPIYLDKEIVGRTTSGNYSFNNGKNLAFGYINNDFSDDELLNGNISIEIEKIKYPAEIIFKPLKQTNFKNN